VDPRKVNKKVLESLIKVGALSEFGKRSAILASIDEIKAKIKPKRQNQAGLFGDDIIEKQTDKNMTLANVEEFTQDQIESLEKQLLGFSLSSRSMDEVLEGLLDYSSHKTNEITKDARIDEPVKIAGVISELRVVVTKKTQAKMAFAKIRDEKGAVNVVIFPKLYSQLESILIENIPVLVVGKVDFRDEDANILADKIDTKESLKKRPASFLVKIPKDTKIEKLKDLKNLLKQHPGNAQVTLTFEGRNEKITLPFGVSWSESLSHKIADLLDEKA
jgi:DNA polymerase-3 subunit alpha